MATARRGIMLWPVAERRSPILEPDHQFAHPIRPLLLRNEVLGQQDEPPGLFVRRLDVAVLALGGIRKPEVDPHRIALGLWAEPERVVLQVFGRFDVVLVGVGPVELDLLALVGNRVNAVLVDALADEVAFAVVATEEAVEVVVDIGLERVHVRARVDRLAKLLNLGHRVRVDP